MLHSYFNELKKISLYLQTTHLLRDVNFTEITIISRGKIVNTMIELMAVINRKNEYVFISFKANGIIDSLF